MTTSTERTRRILEKAEAQRKKRKTIRLVSIITSAVAAVIIAFNLVLFVPYTVGDADITAYKTSEYYGVIQKLYGLTYSPRKTNNFTEWVGSLPIYGGANRGEAPTGPSSNDGNGSNKYQETTLNQTDGVIEGDLFKRSDAHVFYLGFTYPDYSVSEDCFGDGGSEIITYRETTYRLRVYDVAGVNSQLMTEYVILPDDGTSFGGYYSQREMYLSEDLTTVTVVSPCYEYATRTVYTVIIDINLSDVTDIKETGRTYVTGSYVSSRISDGNMLVITDFRVGRNVDFDNKRLYIPHYGKLGELQPLPADDIVCPSDASSPRYTVIYSLNAERDVTDSVALMSFSDDVYVSQNNLFATRTFNKSVKTHNEYKLEYTYNNTEIRVVPYGNGDLGEPRSVTAAGSVLDRYSLDEYDGMLRMFTTIRVFNTTYSYMGENPYKDAFDDRCAFYCFDLDTLEQTAKVVDFAPAGETVKSARFYGDTAYVCTAKMVFTQITDPVFAFDLSDLDNISYTDTGTIPGYSLSLNSFAFDTLLGIGYGDNSSTLKIELYEQTGSDVESAAKYEEQRVWFSVEYKAHLIDADNGIIGLGIQSQLDDRNTRYAIFRYDGYTLTEIASVETESNNTDYMRATVIDDCVYVLEDDGYGTASEIKVVKIA